MLLAAGADPAAARNRRSSQPLHYAADGYLENSAWNPGRQVQMIRLLLDAGANINAQDKNGATPLHRAVRTRCAAAVKCFLDAGADPKIRNKPGSTAFHLAVQNTGRGGSGSESARAAQREIVETFLKRGVSPKIADAKGKSVVDWARSDWIREMLAGHDILEHFHQSCSDELDSGASGLFGFWLPPSPRLRRTGRFSSVAGFFKPAPSPKPRQKPKILTAHRDIFSVNALIIIGSQALLRGESRSFLERIWKHYEQM
jgi:hypothetical protein